MSKKKNVKNDNTVSVVGTPTMLLLPGRNYKFKVSDAQYMLTIPKKGKYIDIDSTMFTEEDGEFDIFAQDADGNYVLYTPSITKVLFGASKYPDLKDNEAFTPIFIRVKEDEVEIIGQVIEMLKEN